MYESLKKIMAIRPTNPTKSEYKSYNSKLYSLFLEANTNLKDIIKAELLDFNQKIFHKFANGNQFSIWKTYSMCEYEDAILTLQMSFLEVITAESIPEWGPLIWIRTCDKAKESLHNQYREGGISASYWTKLRKKDEESNISFIEDTTESSYDIDFTNSYKDPERLMMEEATSNFLVELIQTAYDEGYITAIGFEIVKRRCLGISYNDIAESFNMSADAVRHRYSRTIAGLKNAMNEEDQCFAAYAM